MKSVFYILLVSFISNFGFAQAPRVGKKAAADYFAKREPDAEEVKAERTKSSDDHFLALNLGKFVSSDAWGWGQRDRQTDIGGTNVGLTYRMQESSGVFDLHLRVEFTDYNVMGQNPLKMSFSPLWTFPDVHSRFPLYFGAGVGAGVFFRQVKDSSPLSLDYQLIMGARFFDVVESTGFFVETGIKNHILLTSPGQFNGVFISAGAIFTF